jgi:putative membrane protein insertion efficiency factor
MMKRILLALVVMYRDWLSPAMHAVFPGGCRYQPTCSQYAAEAIEAHGARRGGWMALKRLARCHPFAQPAHGAFDPVPLPDPAGSPRHGSDASPPTHYHKTGDHLGSDGRNFAASGLLTRPLLTGNQRQDRSFARDSQS